MPRCDRCGAAYEASHACPAGGLEAFTVLLTHAAESSSDAVTQPAAQLPGEPTKIAADPLLPDVLGGFKLDFVAGTGGMGTVYRAHDQRLGTPVAVKVMKRSALADPRNVERAQREIVAASRVHHSGINPVLGYGVLGDGRVWFASPFLEGRALDALLAKQEPIAWPLVVPVLAEVASILGAAHAAGVVHRDVKPANVFLSRQSDGAVCVKLIDFGLALLGDAEGGIPQTTVKSVSGTAQFISPEQALGQDVDARADLYALGITAFQLLTGQVPFDDATGTAIMRRQVFEEAPRLRSKVKVPRPLEALVASLLSKKLDDRPGSAREVRDRLDELRFEAPAGDSVLHHLAQQWARSHPPSLGTRLRALWAG